MSLNYTALATGALGFTVALAWNDAVHATVRSLFPSADKKGAARAALLYALVVTLFVVFVVAVINRARRFVHERGAHAAEPTAAPAKVVVGGPSAPPVRAPGERFTPAPLVRLWEPARRA